MTRLQDRQRALVLREEGKSYSQIKEILNVGKGTLSFWLKDHPLPEKRIRELRDWNQQRIERYRQTRHTQKENRLKIVYEQQKKIVFPFSKRDLLIAGLFLYWGERSKTKPELEVANTDPAVPRFFIYWVTKFLKLDKSKIRAHLHLYSDMDVEKELIFWSRALDIQKTQFMKPYIKKKSSKTINRGTFGHGTCTIRVGSVRVAEGVYMGLKAIRDRFGP